MITPASPVAHPLPILPGCVAYSTVALPTLRIDELHSEERKIAEGFSSEKRRSEFLLGRSAARKALNLVRERTHTLEPVRPLLRGEHGDPIWPKHLVGSIAHSSGWGAAAVALKKDCLGVGIDFELESTTTKQDISSHVCLPEERAWVKESTSLEQKRVISIFVAKEATYKAFFPCHGEFFDFSAVRVDWSDALPGFSGTLCIPLGQFPVGYRFPITVNVANGWITAAVALNCTE